MSSLLFIYNAKSGKLNALFDAGHKLFSPNTYQCNLCALTFDTFTENETWKAFRENSNINMRFLHIDEFEKKFPNQTFKYPIILLKKNGGLQEFLFPKEINQLKNIDELIAVIEDKFKITGTIS